MVQLGNKKARNDEIKKVKIEVNKQLNVDL